MTSREHAEDRTGAGASTVGRGKFHGFEVDTDDLRRFARALTQATDTLLHAENAGRPGALRAGDEFRPAGAGARPVPGWLHDYDTSWRALRDGVLHAHSDAVQSLRETAHAYLDSEAHAGQLLAAAGPPAPGLPLADVGHLPHLGAAAAEAGFPDPAEPAGYGGQPTRNGTDSVSADLDSAVEVWRRRRDSAATAVGELRDALTRLRWQGSAAEAFISWTQDHLNRCAALTNHAHTAHAALTRADLAAPHPIDPPQPWARPPASTTPVQSSSSPGPVPPQHLTNEVNTTQPATTAPARPLGEQHPDQQHPDEQHPAQADPAQEHPVRDRLDDEQLELAEAVSDHEAEPDDGAPVHDLPRHAASAQDAPARNDIPAAALAATLPVAAMASAALFARTDRAHHIIRDIPLPPPIPGPSTHLGTAAGPPATNVPPGRRAHPATDPRAHSPSTPADRATPPDGPDQSSTVEGPLPPIRTNPEAVWINLARADDPPAWIDLAATRGLGLDGPGAHDIARTLWQRLHDHHPRALLIVPEPLAGRLLPHPGPGTPVPGVVVVPDPRQGLTTSWAEVERRRDVGLHTAPVVLFAPTPITDTARSDLASTLSRSPQTAFAAVLLGNWDTGTTLTITEQHHVSDHHRPAPGLPPLTGASLQPTTLDTLTTPAPPVPAQDTDSPPIEPSEVSAPAEVGSQRTPLALTVLGPVQLHYRRPADDTAGEEVLAVPGISRPGRELLAYLAAHPGGATRDAIIEALWPDSAADRPDTAFHTTLSRLRKRLRDTTGTPTTDEIIVATDGRYHLDRAQVTVDYWSFLETHPRNPDPTLRRHDHYLAIQLYQGPFAADSTGEWAHTIREATRRRYLEAIHDLTTTEIATNPDLALELLDRARNLEPLNEAIYRTIMRIHLNADRYDDARGTYELLHTHLVTIEVTPDVETERLAAIFSTSTSAAPTEHGTEWRP